MNAIAWRLLDNSLAFFFCEESGYWLVNTKAYPIIEIVSYRVVF